MQQLFLCPNLIGNQSSNVKDVCRTELKKNKVSGIRMYYTFNQIYQKMKVFLTVMLFGNKNISEQQRIPFL